MADQGAADRVAVRSVDVDGTVFGIATPPWSGVVRTSNTSSDGLAGELRCGRSRMPLIAMELAALTRRR